LSLLQKVLTFLSYLLHPKLPFAATATRAPYGTVLALSSSLLHCLHFPSRLPLRNPPSNIPHFELPGTQAERETSRDVHQEKSSRKHREEGTGRSAATHFISFEIPPSPPIFSLSSTTGQQADKTGRVNTGLVSFPIVALNIFLPFGLTGDARGTYVSLQQQREAASSKSCSHFHLSQVAQQSSIPGCWVQSR
jgi:hypothetical protein